MNLKKKYTTDTLRHSDGEKKRRRCPHVSPSLPLSASVPPRLRGIFIGLAAVTMALSFASACSEAPGKSSGAGVSSRPATLAADEPEAPRVRLNTTYAPPTGRVIEVKAGGDFQAALNEARPGDVITLQAGATFTGNFTLPNKSGQP